MPNLGESNPTTRALVKVKLLLMGDTKTGKTDYLMQAAKAGLNILYLDGDVGLQTLMNEERLPAEFRHRITYMAIGDRNNDRGEYESRMAKFFVEFTTSGVFLWNDTKGEIFNRKDYEVLLADPEDPESEVIGGDEIWEIRPSKLDNNVLVAMDSWTTLIQSLIMWKADDLSIDLMDIEKHGREMYTGAGHKATQFLTLLRGFPCHVAVIGHPREYQKRSPPAGSKGQVAEKDMKLDWIKMVPISTSNPHALTMGKHFSDIAWIDVNAMGKRTIDFKPSTDRIIGGHFDQKGDVDTMTFASLVKQVGGTIDPTATTDPWLTRFGPGQFKIAGSAKKPLTGSTAATATPVKVATGGLSALMQRNKPAT